MILPRLNKYILLPTAGFTTGFLLFLKGWPDDKRSIFFTNTAEKRELHDSKPLSLQRQDIIDQIKTLPLYKELKNNPDVKCLTQSQRVPRRHRPYHVGQGQLFGEAKLEIDPIIFHNTNEQSLVIFYHLGNSLKSHRSSFVSNGISSLLLDEGLCYCGFPLLPSKRGVTAKLSLRFMKDIPADTTVVLRAKVTEFKGRKCIIDGSLQSLPKKNIYQALPNQGPTSSDTYATGHCILVEPKWFKYLKNIHIF